MSAFDWESGYERRGGGGLDQLSLPRAQKEVLARALLAEFGVTSIHQRDDELIHKCVLPWHDDGKPSASLNFDRLAYRCFGCQSKGGLIWLIASVRDQTGSQVRDWLNEQTGLGGAEFDLQAMLDLIDALYAPRARSATPIPKFSPRVLDPWKPIVHPWLTTGVPDLGIVGRGIPEQNVRDMQVGYAPDYVMSRKDDGTPAHTSERIVIPHFWRGDLVGWQSRRLWDDGTPKYLSTVDFPKDRTIYNYDPKRRRALAVESPMTVLRHRHHLPIEGTFGASVTDSQVRLLAEHGEVVLWFDNDPAGWKAIMGHDEGVGRKKIHVPGLVERLDPYCSVLVVDSPWAADGADMDDEAAEALYESAVPYAVWEKPIALRCWVCKREHVGGC